MANTFDFSPVLHASRTNVLLDKGPDGVFSPAELVGRRYDTLCRLSGALFSGTPEDWIRHLRAALQSDGACVFLPDPNGGELQAYAFDFPPGAETFQDGTPIAFEGTIAGRVFQTGKLWAGSVEEACALFTNPYPVMLTAGFKSGCMLPIPGRQRVLGTLGLGRRADNPYSQDELNFLMQVSIQIAIAVEIALAYEEIRELNKSLSHHKFYLQEEIRSEINFDEIVGKSVALQRLLKKVETVAPTDSTVCICGETG